jgi:hypothetical protein
MSASGRGDRPSCVMHVTVNHVLRLSLPLSGNRFSIRYIIVLKILLKIARNPDIPKTSPPALKTYNACKC